MNDFSDLWNIKKFEKVLIIGHKPCVVIMPHLFGNKSFEYFAAKSQVI
jgi:hypothetical protein